MAMKQRLNNIPVLIDKTDVTGHVFDFDSKRGHFLIQTVYDLLELF